MPDHATSSSPAVQAQLDRLFAHGPGTDTLGLDRITKLLARLGDPHRHLPPVFHVAGTNGKGSTCAFLRAALEAAGHHVHVYTSPHLIRFNERIRLAGKLIEDDALAPLLEEVLDVAEDLNASFFEVTTAATFLAFSRTLADACVVEVGLGGRLDATNVLPAPTVCGIAALGLDHQAFLGDTLQQIAVEKAGIAKPGVPLVTMAYPRDIEAKIAAVAQAAGAALLIEGRDWRVDGRWPACVYADVSGQLEMPAFPGLPGEHQARNFALAVAMLRHQDRVRVPTAAFRTATGLVRWPARLQHLVPGPLAMLAPRGAFILVDGGHNENAARALAPAICDRAEGGAVHVVLGMLANKDLLGVLRQLAPLATTVTGVPVAGHIHHDPDAIATAARALGVATTYTAPDLRPALAALPRSREPLVLIVGSLYLAGEALRLNDELPD